MNSDRAIVCIKNKMGADEWMETKPAIKGSKKRKSRCRDAKKCAGQKKVLWMLIPGRFSFDIFIKRL